jgi:RimJ/RimL family protein N-acetyltransferase
LRLRAHRVDDFEDSAAMWADPVITRYITGRPSSEQESWFRLLRHAGQWALLGFGSWVVEEKSTGKFVGEVGFADYRRPLPLISGLPELGWVVASHMHRKGYATEAVRAALLWADEQLRAVRTACIISPENIASLRVAQKCGYEEFERIMYDGQPIIVFVRKA